MVRRSPFKGSARALLGALVVLGALAHPALASDEWDWGAVEAMDDAPVTRSPAAAASAVHAQSVEPRSAENAFPDFTAPPVTALSLYAGLPPFEVIQSQRDTDMHPCANCHRWVKSNPEPRKLKTPHHNFELKHGLHGHGQFWCFTCHDVDNNFSLKTLEGDPVDFDHAYVVCSQCHAQQARDWAHGAHGKRVGNWQGQRQVLNCTACHYQHRPAIAPREPLPGPVMRVGLPRPDHWVAADEREAQGAGHGQGEQRAWQRDIERRRESAPQDQTPDTAASDGSESSDAES